jgi:glycosyltransferase involved in cell wall biosynthesis
MALRIASVQNGDYLAAMTLLDSGATEPYFGMNESVRALQNLLGEHHALVISMDATLYRQQVGNTLLVGLDHSWFRWRIPRIPWELRARRVIAELKRFRPTHLLLRVDSLLGLRIAQWAIRNGIPAIAILSNSVWSNKPRVRKINKKFIAALNAKEFTHVYNFKKTACASVIEYGLAPHKLRAYQFFGERHPSACAPKEIDSTKPCELLFAGRMTLLKGPLDVLEAVKILRSSGFPIRATFLGDGELLPLVRQMANEIGREHVRVLGQVDNAYMFELLRSSTFACVPTHAEFPEGMPMSLTEALASRTPVIASDCLVFTRSFVDDEGVKFFAAKDPQNLADVVRRAWESPESYKRLSLTTLNAYERVSTDFCFSSILSSWKTLIRA